MSEFENENSEFPEENIEIPDDLSSLDEDADVIEAELVKEEDEVAEESALDDLVEKLSAERDDYLKALQQTAADFDNYRKRVTKQFQDAGDQKVESLMIKLLPALDNIELALAHSKDNAELGSVLVQISNGIRDVLVKEGLEPISDADVDFDPTCHDAVMHEPGEGPAKVSEVLRSGYKWKQRVIRPAMVKVVGQG
ncbi:MAG: nucleotide exchange factor GrpE [Actinomycetota bacterium]|nr:MAG: nucleotide exchange factor GrpE [Actinomycetota bacterium]